MRAIVVGAGLSGLAAARRLERAGVEVTVLERGETAGGRVRTDVVDGYIVDAGADAATQGYARWLALAEQAGLGGLVAHPSPVLGIVRDGRILDIDPTKPLQAARTQALSARAKAHMGVGLVRLRKQLAGVDSYELNRSADLDDPGDDAYAFARRYFGREAADYVLDGALRLVTGSGARQASRLGALGALSGWSVPTLTLRGGLAQVATRTAAQLRDVRFGCQVTRVAAGAPGVGVTYVDPSGDELYEPADGCVIASMYREARQLWPELDGLASGFAAALRDVSLISISLGYARRPATRSYIVSVPTAELPDVLLIFMQHNKAPDRAPAGHGLITLYTDTLATPRYLASSDDELVEWAAATVERLCPELRGTRDLGHVVRWPRAGYLADPGFWLRSRKLLEAQPAGGRIVLAGDLFGAGSMESSVRWGERAADRLASTLRAAAPAGSPAHPTA